MSAHRPIAHRAFTVLLAFLLVGGVVAPITATQPAAAQDSTDDTAEEVACYSISSMAGPGGYLLNEACQDWTTDTTTYDGDAAATQTTLHGTAVSQWESSEAIRTVLQNYGQDTSTIASLEARNAIATAYEQGNSSSTADQMARSEIRDYYSQRQINTLETYTKGAEQFRYIANLTSTEPDLYDEFVYVPIQDNYDGENLIIEKQQIVGTVNRSFTLENGSTHNYSAIEQEFAYTYQPTGDTYSGTVVIDPFQDTYPKTFSDNDGGGYGLKTSGRVVVRESYVGTSYDLSSGLPSQIVSDPEAWSGIMSDWQNESADVTTNYVDIAPDLYSEMDAGNLDPNELRGAEGMVRYLSGDSNATSGDYRTALNYVLDTSNPNLTETSTMRVQIDGYTGLDWNESVDSTSREPIPTDPMNSTIEGLLFADGVSSISVNQTYSTTATDNQSFYVVQEDGTQTTLIEGNLTVRAIYDSSGNEVQNASYSEPKYDSYNADEFVQYLEENEEARAAIISDDEDDSSGFQIPGIPGFPNAGGAFIGLVIIGGAVVVVVGVVTDLGPGR